jgi:hypothetical protein
MGGVGGAVAKTGSGFDWGNKTLDALQSIDILYETENLIQEWAVKLLLAKN